MHFLSLLLISCLLLSSASCFNLSCNGRSIYSKITINNNAGYVPQFYTTFGISLEANETLTQNLTVSLIANNQCIPNSVATSFNFSTSECKPFFDWTSCGRKFYLNCTKEYKQSNKQISFTASGKVSYLNKTIQCTDGGQVVVWENKSTPVDDSSDLGIIIGGVVGGVVLIGIGAVIFWRYRKNKKEKSLLTQEE